MLTKKLVLLSGVVAVLGGCGQTTSTDSNTSTANIAMGNTSAAASATPAVNRVRGVITAIGTDLDGDDVVDATGLVALPGLVDLHTHVREPGREDAETVLTGSQAAARGGFTCVHAMANTEPVADTRD